MNWRMLVLAVVGTLFLGGLIGEVQTRHANTLATEAAQAATEAAKSAADVRQALDESRGGPKAGIYTPGPQGGGIGGFANGKSYVNRIPQDNFTTLLEPTQGFTPVPAGTNNIDCESLGVWETANLATFWNIQYPQFDSGAQTAFGQALVSCAVQPNGACVNPDGGLAIINTNVQLGAQLGDSGCTWGFDAGPEPGLSRLCFQCSAGVATQLHAAISGDLAAQSWEASTPTIIAVQPSAVQTILASPQIVEFQVPWGAASGVTGMSIGPASAPVAVLTGVYAANGGHAAGYIPVGTYVPGTYAVNFTTTYPGGVASLPAAFSFVSAPTVSSLSIAYGTALPGTSASSLYAFATDAVGAALTATIGGTNFAGSACTVTLNGVACTGVSGSSTSLTCTPGATSNPSAVGLGNVVVTCSGNSGTGPNLVTYLDDPLTILGAANVFAWYEPRVCTQSSGNVTAITDLSGNGNVPSTITAVTYTAIDANFNNQPSWSYNGTSSTMAFTSVTNPSSTLIMDYVALRLGSTATAALISDSSNNYTMEEVTNMNYGTGGVFAALSSNTGVLNTTTTIMGYGNTNNGGNVTSNISLANGTPVTANTAGSNAYGANTAFTIGSRSGGSIPMNVKLGLVVRALLNPTTTQSNKLHSYAQARWAVP